MKNLITISLFFVLFSNSFGQELQSKRIDTMLREIDTTSLTSQTLYNRAIPFASLDIFNDSINISNAKHFEQALLELYNTSNHQKYISYQSVQTYNSDFNTITNYNGVDIGIINSKFQLLNYAENNLSESALRVVNDKFERINEEKPIFYTKNVLIISPIKSNVIGNSITYNFSNNFFFQSNSNRTINSITANFDTSDDYIIFNNGSFTTTSISVNYQETGYKTLTFLVNFSDGTSLTTQSEIHVKRTPPPPPTGQTSLLHWPNANTASEDYPIPFQGYDENTAISGELEYRIYYGNDQNKILKPIIIADGIDPGDKRKISDDDPHPGDNNEKHHSLEELMVFFDSNGSESSIINELTSYPLNYDVIVVNHPVYQRNGRTIDGGADYIERNAMNHVSFYQYINRELEENESDEKLIVMGPSMGALITRYALAFMEKKYDETGDEKWNHNCRLWVSMDGPHLGANIPIGIQSLLNQMRFSSAATTNFVNKWLGSPAAKQMMIDKYNGSIYVLELESQQYIETSQLKTDYLNSKTISQGFDEDRGHPFYINFYNNLYNNGIAGSDGYPVSEDIDIIALINGSLSGVRTYTDPTRDFANGTYLPNGGKAVKVKFNVNYHYPWGHTWSQYIGSIESNAMPSYNINSMVSKKLGRKKEIINKNPRGVLDNVPGSFFPSYAMALESISGFSFPNYPLSVSVDIVTNRQVHSFMPVVSTLGFKNPNINWNQSFNNRNLSCTGEIPFDSYYAPEVNERHVTFTQDSVDWLRGWITGDDKAGPPLGLSTGDISGDSTICLGEQKTYSFEECQVSGTVNWSCSSNLSNEYSDNSHIIVESNSQTGVKWVQANVDGVIKRKKLIGEPLFVFQTYDNDIFAEICVESYGIDFDEQGITGVVWEQTNVGEGNSGVLGSEVDNEYCRMVFGGANNVVEGIVTLTNDCGETIKPFSIIIPSHHQCTSLVIETISRNRYRVTDPCNHDEIIYIDETELYNQYGVKIENIEPSQDQLVISNTNNDSGSIRIIKVTTPEGKTGTKRVIVE